MKDISKIYEELIKKDKKKEDIIFEENTQVSNDPFEKFLNKLDEKISQHLLTEQEDSRVDSNDKDDVKKDIAENPYTEELEKLSKNADEKKLINEDEKIANLISEQIQEEIGKVKTQISRIAFEGSGGGSVAVQYADGGTMNGDLNVTGKYLSAGRDLATIIANSGGGGGGPTDRLLSGSQVLKLNSDGTIDFPNNTITPQDEIILTLESTKVLDGFYNRLALSPYGFFASDHNGNSLTINSVDNEILIDSNNMYYWKFNNQGALEGPFGTLNVKGNLSASNIVYASGGNSFLWNSTYTTVSSNSAHWESTYTTVKGNSATWGAAVLGESQILIAEVKNAESFSLQRGDVVYAFGATGNKMSVKLASNTDDTTSSKTIGVVNGTITAGGTGFITSVGRMDQLTLGAFNEGDALWLSSTAGKFTNIKPVAPNHGVFLGIVERANDGDGIAYIKIQNGYELNEIHDVLITNVSAGDVLRRNAGNTVWQNTKDGNHWDSVYTTVSTNSANNWENQILKTYTHTNFLLLSGGTMSGTLTAANISLTNATIQTSPSVVQSNDYLILRINGTNRAIRLSDFV